MFAKRSRSAIFSATSLAREIRIAAVTEIIVIPSNKVAIVARTATRLLRDAHL